MSIASSSDLISGNSTSITVVFICGRKAAELGVYSQILILDCLEFNSMKGHLQKPPQSVLSWNYVKFHAGAGEMLQWLRVRITLPEGPEFNSQHSRQVAHSWNSCCRGPDASKDAHVSMVFTHTHMTENKVLKTKLHCISGDSDFF